MKTRIIVSISIAAGIMACSTAKKASIPTAVAPAAAPAAGSPAIARPANGIYEPGPAELAAIQARYADANLDQLKLGHMIYSIGACVQCHKAMNIYQRSEAQWAGILADMAQRARLSAAQQEAVHRYILAVKAAKASQPK